MSQIIPKVDAAAVAAVGALAGQNIITEDELSLVGSGAQGGFSFNGSTDYLEGTRDDFGTSDFTLVYDLLYDDVPTGTEYLGVKTSGNNRWYFFINATSYRLAIVDGVGNTNFYSWTVTPSANHRNVILTADRSGNATLYLNGNSQGTQDISGDSAVNLGSGNTASQYIGHNSLSVDGDIYQVRYYTEAKTSGQVLNIAKGHNDTDGLWLKLAPTSTNVSGWTDISGNDRSFAANGATRIESNISKQYTSHSEYTQWQRKDGGYYLNGGYLKSSAVVSDAAHTYLVSFIANTIDGNDATLIADRGASGQGEILTIDSAGVNLYLDNGSVIFNFDNAAYTFETGKLYVVAAVLDPATGYSVFVNGHKIHTNSTAFSAVAASSTIQLGADNNGANRNLDGEIKLAQAFNYALSDADAQAYSRGEGLSHSDTMRASENSFDNSKSLRATTVTGLTIGDDSIVGTNSSGATAFVNTQNAYLELSQWRAGATYQVKVTFGGSTSMTFGDDGGSVAVSGSSGTQTYNYTKTDDSKLYFAISNGNAVNVTAIRVYPLAAVINLQPENATETVWNNSYNAFNAVNNGATLIKPTAQAAYTLKQDEISNKIVGPAYYFDGGNLSYANLPAAAFPENNATYAVAARFNTSEIGARQTIFSVQDGSDYIIIRVESDGEIHYYTDFAATLATGFNVEANTWYDLVVVCASTKREVYLNGAKIAESLATAVAQGVTDVEVGRFNGADGFQGLMNSVRVFNRALTESEVLDISHGKSLGYADAGADGTTATSGTLTVGKRYRIDTFNAGDDFTNIGAASNASGVEFIATGTTPTTWTNSSVVAQLGEVLSLLPSGIASGKWFDQRPGGYHGSLTGVSPINVGALSCDKVLSATNLPTSSAGLATGRVWNDSGTLKVV